MRHSEGLYFMNASHYKSHGNQTIWKVMSKLKFEHKTLNTKNNKKDKTRMCYAKQKKIGFYFNSKHEPVCVCTVYSTCYGYII